jgi:hypothetical protein
VATSAEGLSLKQGEARWGDGMHAEADGAHCCGTGDVLEVPTPINAGWW